MQPLQLSLGRRGGRLEGEELAPTFSSVGRAEIPTISPLGVMRAAGLLGRWTERWRQPIGRAGNGG